MLYCGLNRTHWAILWDKLISRSDDLCLLKTADFTQRALCKRIPTASFVNLFVLEQDSLKDVGSKDSTLKDYNSLGSAITQTPHCDHYPPPHPTTWSPHSPSEECHHIDKELTDLTLPPHL